MSYSEADKASSDFLAGKISLSDYRDVIPSRGAGVYATAIIGRQIRELFKFVLILLCKTLGIKKGG